MSVDSLVHLTGRLCDAAERVVASNPGRMGAIQTSDDDVEVTCPDCRRINDLALQTLTDGTQVYPEHTALKANGQQQDYVVLSESERARVWVRPLRDAYRHVGRPAPANLRDLTPEEHERGGLGWVKYETYEPGTHGSALGRFWTARELKGGCGQVTTMSRPIAETYARDPKHYGGTFCVTCRNHYPVGADGEFVWVETDGRDGPRVGT
jgi:hypothetical protein